MKNGKEIMVLLLLMVLVAASVFFAISRLKDSAEYFPPRSSYSPWPNGLKAFYELLESSGFEVTQYGGNEYHYPADACVVIADGKAGDPSAMFGSGLNYTQIKGWISEGGTLVVLSEAEFWSLGKQIFNVLDGKPADNFLEMIEDMEGLGYMDDDDAVLSVPPETVMYHEDQGSDGNALALFREYQAGQVFQLQDDKPALWDGVDRIEVADQYSLGGINGTALLTVDPDIPVVVYRKFGEGEIFWVTCPEILANDWISRQDNHHFGLALLDRASGGGVVMFDEHLNGYRVKGYNAGSMITKTIGGRLMLLLCLAAAVLFFGLAIRPAKFHPQKVMPRRQASEMVFAQASLYRRARLQDSIAGRLIDGLKRSYMVANHLAVPPSTSELSKAFSQAPQLTAEVDPVLLEYLSGESTPASPEGLFRLAKACYQVQLRLR